MNKLLENCIFLKDNDRFSVLRAKAFDFRNNYIGDTIVRDGIFNVITSYCATKEHQIKMIKFPIYDENFWAFTRVKNGIIFVTINTALPLNCQIFAAAHELYHIYKYLEEIQSDYIENGSILTKTVINEEVISEEDREANAFAALILAPKEQIEKQAKLRGKEFTDSDLMDLIHFMDCFAMPYKAMVLKLFECGRYSENVADLLLQNENRQTLEEAYVIDCGTKWLEPTFENNLKSFQTLIDMNVKNLSVTKSRAKEDLEYLDMLSKKFSK